MTTPRFDPDSTPEPPTPRHEICLDLNCARDLIERLARVLGKPGVAFDIEMLDEHEQFALRAESQRLYSASVGLWARLLTALGVEPSETDC